MSVVPDTLLVPDHLLEPRFSQLDMTGVNTGILYDKGYTPVDYRNFDGSYNCTYSSDISTFYNILKGVKSSVVSSSVIVPIADSVMVHMSNHLENTGRIPVGIAVYNYNQIVPNALSDGMVEFQTVNGEPALVNLPPPPGGSNADVYEECTFAAFSPYVNIVSNPVTFDFSNNFRFTNRTISALYFDAGDNTGFHQITSNGTYSVEYASFSLKNICVKVVLDGNEILYANSKIRVVNTSSSSSGSGNDPYAWDVETFTSNVYSDGVYPKAKISIRYANGSSFSKQPLIVAEGFDPFSDPLGLFLKDDDKYGYGFRNIKTFYEELQNHPNIGDYDIIYIDWFNSTCSIESNADILINVLEWVNARKPVGEKNILIGQSMGGLIARYALSLMEQNHTLYPNHEVSLYVSHDSPHLGANIPLAYMYLIQSVLDAIIVSDDITIMGPGDVFLLGEQLISDHAYVNLYRNEFLALRDGTGIKQMLKYYVNPLLTIDTSQFNSFQQTLGMLDFPHGDTSQGTLNLCISNGGRNNYTLTSPLFRVGRKSINTNPIMVLTYLIQSLLDGSINSLYGASLFSIFEELEINPFINASDPLLHYKKSFTKLHSWGEPYIAVNPEIAITAPSSAIPLDNVHGSYYYIGFLEPLKSPSVINALNTLGIEIDFQKRFLFVPTVSSLCYGNGNVLVDSLYHHDFNTLGPPDINKIPFDGYRFHSSSASQHISMDNDDFSFFRELDGIQICDSSTVSGKQYYLNKPGFTVTWSSSDTNIATINANTGELTPHGFGECKIYADFNSSHGGHVRLKQKFRRHLPSTISFPTYTLIASDLTPRDEYSFDTYAVNASESPSGAHIPDSLMSYVKYCWGRKQLGSSSITWTEGNSRWYNVTLPIFEDHTFYFRVRYLNTYSTTYSIHCLSLPRMIPVDPLGNLYTEDMGEVIVQLKGGATGESVTFHCMGIEAVFDHEPTLAELCRRLLDYDVFVTEVKKLKPWGDEDMVIIPYSYMAGDSGESVQEVMVFQYNPDIQ